MVAAGPLAERALARAGIDPMRPERLAFIDVADAGADTLVEQKLAECLRLGSPGAPNDLLEIEGIDENVGSQVGDRLVDIRNELHDRRREADRDRKQRSSVEPQLLTLRR